MGGGDPLGRVGAPHVAGGPVAAEPAPAPPRREGKSRGWGESPFPDPGEGWGGAIREVLKVNRKKKIKLHNLSLAKRAEGSSSAAPRAARKI